MLVEFSLVPLRAFFDGLGLLVCELVHRGVGLELGVNYSERRGTNFRSLEWQVRRPKVGWVMSHSFNGESAGFADSHGGDVILTGK